MKKIFISCLVVLISTACNHQEQKAREEKATDSVTVETQPQQTSGSDINNLTINDEALLKAFYVDAKRNPVSKKFSTILSLPLKDMFREETIGLMEASEDQSIEVYVVDKKYFSPDDQFCLVVTDGMIKGNDCHPCGGVLGMFILKKNDKGKWDCVHKNYDVRLQGSYGSISATPVIYEISKGEYVADMSSGYSAMGSSFQNEYNFILLDGSFRAIDIGIAEEDGDSFYYDNSGACDAENTEIPPCYDFSSDISFVPSKNQDTYYDLKVITKGTKPSEEGASQRTTPYYRERVYQWSNDKYTLASDTQKK